MADITATHGRSSLGGEPLEEPVLIPAPLAHAPSIAGSLLLLALPHGGQRSARRNAWAGMSADAALSRARAEADRALALAELRSTHRFGSTG